MIRVLHMIGSLEIGGSQAMVMNIYRNIDRSKIQFDFIVDHPENAFFSEEITQLGGKIYYFPSFKGNNYYEIKKTWNNFFKEHPEYKILHSHVRSYASLYLPIAKKYGLKTIIHSHSTSNGSGIKALVKQILQYPLRFQADYFFGCSKIAGEWLFGKKVVNSAKYYMVKNAINLNDYCSTDKREYYRKMINAKDDIVFGHVGRLHEAKNHEFLLEVFKKIHFQNPNTKLVIIGEGELRSSIEKNIIFEFI